MLSKPAGVQLSNQETSDTEMDVATHCCYAWSLGTGNIIIGVLNVIGSILQIAVVAYNWDLYRYANDDITGENSDTKRELVTVLVFGIIQAICSVLLITGAVKGMAEFSVFSWMMLTEPPERETSRTENYCCRDGSPESVMLWVLSQEQYHHHCLPIREMAILTQCSCGCSLKTATISIAIFYLVSSRAQIATTAYNLEIHQYVGGDEVKAEEMVADTKLEVITGLVCGIIHTVCSIILLVGVTQEKASKLIPWIVVETLGTAVAILLFIVVFIAASSYSFIIFLLVFADTKLEVITGLVCGIIHTVCSIIVLVGATQEKASVLLPWIVLEILGTAAAIVICVVVFMAAGSYGLLIVAMTFLLLLLNIYFLRVVYSYFRSLCERARSAKLTDMETAGM